MAITTRSDLLTVRAACRLLAWLLGLAVLPVVSHAEPLAEDPMGPSTVTAAMGSSLPSPGGPLGDPAFFIETIEVEGLHRASPAILVSESLLEAGRGYSESELQEAIYRINRLPFVLETRFALSRGSERGRYRLVIEVEEVARFFFGAEAGATVFARDLSLDELEPEDVSRRSDALVGVRFFMGTYGTFFTAVTTTGSVQLGLARYQLFGRRIFMSLGLVRQGCCPVTVRPLALDPTFSRWSADESSVRGTLTLGIPLGGNQSLRFEAWRFQTLDDGSVQGRRVQILDALGSDAVFDFHRDLVDQAVELGWIYDSTDDPTFPTRGLALSATYQQRELRTELLGDGVVGVLDPAGLPGFAGPSPVDMRSRMYRLALSASRHWSPGPRHVISLGLRLAVGRSEVSDVPLGGDRLLSDETLDLFEAGLSLRHSMTLWEGARHLPARELWWESTADIGREQTSPSFDLAHNPLERRSFESALVFRSRWGIFRLAFSIVDVETAG